MLKAVVDNKLANSVASGTDGAVGASSSPSKGAACGSGVHAAVGAANTGGHTSGCYEHKAQVLYGGV